MLLECSEILFYLGDLFLNKYELVTVSTVNKYFFKSTRVPKLGYLGHNIIAKLDLDRLEITPFFNYFKTNKRDSQLNVTSNYETQVVQSCQDYHMINHLIKMILNLFFYSDKSKLISLNQNSKTCLESGIITRIKYNGLDICRVILRDKPQLFRRRFRNLHKKLSIKDLKHRQQHLRKNFRNCYAIII